jgi:hypothetical protein
MKTNRVVSCNFVLSRIALISLQQKRTCFVLSTLQHATFDVLLLCALSVFAFHLLTVCPVEVRRNGIMRERERAEDTLCTANRFLF